VAHLRRAAVSSGSAEAAVPDVRRAVFSSLDYIYVPVADIDDEALHGVVNRGLPHGGARTERHHLPGGGTALCGLQHSRSATASPALASTGMPDARGVAAHENGHQPSGPDRHANTGCRQPPFHVLRTNGSAHTTRGMTELCRGQAAMDKYVGWGRFPVDVPWPTAREGRLSAP
jgi:hypothetical protein